MISKSDFFTSKNTLNSATKVDQSQTHDYLATIDALARTTHLSLYVIDYQTQGFEYVSSNPLFLCGLTSDEVREMGYDFYLNFVPKEDLELLLKINTIGFDFYDQIPLADRKKYTLSYSFHLCLAEGSHILINQKVTPLFLTNDGMLWKALCVVTLSSQKEAGNIKIFKENENIVFKYDLKKEVWEQETRIELTDREKEILTLSARGYTMKQVAENAFLSFDTIKFHRKKIFDKLEVDNISEAIFFAINNKLI